MNLVKTAMLLAAMTALFMVVGFLIGGAAGAVIALGAAAAMNAYAFWNSDKLALRMHNARPVTRASHPELHQMVVELSRNADLPTPAIYVIETDQPNAFATGRNPDNAAVAATTGLMRMLTREELAGVMAHELAHIKNRDTLIMTVAATIAGAISFLAQFGMFFGSSTGDNRNPIGFIGLILAVILAPIAAMLVQSLISRTREYSADKLGGEICRNPIWLADALRKISGGAARTEMRSAERHPASAHLFIVNPLSGARMDNLFSTHPAMENRVAALEAQARAAGLSVPAAAAAPAGPAASARRGGFWGGRAAPRADGAADAEDAGARSRTPIVRRKNRNPWRRR